MTYSVELSARALHDLDILYFEKNAAESDSAALWFGHLQEAIESLSEFPHRCSLAPERGGFHQMAEARNLRNLLYGNKPHIFRIIFDIDETARTVNVLHIRHAARQPAT